MSARRRRDAPCLGPESPPVGRLPSPEDDVKEHEIQPIKPYTIDDDGMNVHADVEVFSFRFRFDLA